MKRLATLLAILTLLAGCAAQQPRELTEGLGNPAQWQAHKVQISQIDGWQITGKLGLKTPDESGSATLQWLQRQSYFDIRLSGPLGQGASRLTGRPGATELEIANQGRYSAESPEALLEEQLGWQLPVSHLLWWVRGLPEPDSRSQLILDADSRLARLTQDEWRVDYLSYLEQDGFALPSRLKLYGKDLEITLVIKDWRPRLLGR
ncbi:MAG TPA: lipoprotein insertase outer membrane protein LolB [Pseudomonas sp.]|jgi:outer membrane lipoprotein LolB|uniref:lipoprotein insertase outer membrane protein LolB n=1 Tax=Pseudomonas sp. TaxID=306 RepID=UPI002CA486C1|nr:lipoprotein insertase outer membrane protein LolB [Pseudomonas sp.]HTO18749.1 lipoprotein insertase outer membrane protein LolB [Pseudomonas sp.]